MRMYSRGRVVGGGQEDGRGAAGNVWRGNEVKRRRIGDGIGSHGRGGVVVMIHSNRRKKLK